MTQTDSRRSAAAPIPLLDVVAGNAPLHDEMLAAIRAVFESGRFLHGPDVAQLESSIAARCGVRHAIGCASGSDALLLALLALDIGPGDEVIVPSFTFFATASAVSRAGAKIVFADIDPATFNLDPQSLAAAITTRTKAVIPVHLYGRCADMRTISQLASDTGITVIEDAAQALGAAQHGRPACAWGRVGCISFYPTKNLGGCGDGGMLTTDDDDLAARLRLFAAHGMNPRYFHRVVGINSRLDTIQAAALNVKLRHLDAWTTARRENAARYRDLFSQAQLGRQVVLPTDDAAGYHVWNQFTIRVVNGQRDALRSHLGAQGISSEVYYPIPLHQQECYRALGYASGSLPETERATREVLSIPIDPSLTLADQQRVVETVSGFFESRQSAAA